MSGDKTRTYLDSLLTELLKEDRPIDPQMRQIITQLLQTTDDECRRQLIAQLTANVRQQLSHIIDDQTSPGP